jgi:nicotinate-nucleotide adenylyltransferase
MRGLFGGTFNPIHAGHLSAAREVASKLGLERVIFIPNANPPHKERGTVSKPADRIAPAETRLAWVEACVADEPLFEVSRCEIDREGPSYLIDTLRELTGGRAEDFIFIVGQDAFREMGQWRAPRELFAACSWAVCTRPPLLEGHLARWLPDVVRDDFLVNEDGRRAMHRSAPTHIELVEIAPVDISASELRAALAAGRTDVARWLPAAARDAILSSGCYTPGPAGGAPSSQTPPQPGDPR